MPRSLTRISLALLLLSSEVWALGLGDIRLESALNEPLRAEIELLSATPEELENLTVSLASADTFSRYGLERPFYLQDLTFEVVRTGRSNGNYIRVRSPTPITEPFLTFLVEAQWSRGRLLREYTVLLDPPTYAPPAVAQQPQVTAPQRAEPADSGEIERQPAPRTAPAPTQQPERRAPEPIAPPQRAATPPPVEEPAAAETPPAPVSERYPYDATPGGDYEVRRGETLWGIAAAMRPDSRLTMNQTMLAIYEANPAAFGGNINILRAGATLSLPSAEEIYNIDRGYAFEEAKRQHAAWGGAPDISEPSVADTAADTRPSLTLVPPDDEPVGVGTGADATTDADEDAVPRTREQEILERIAEIEAASVPAQQSLIEIRNNELATLRRELAEIRGEAYEPEDADTAVPADEDLDAIMADETAESDAAADAADETAEPERADPTPTAVRRIEEPSIFERITGWLTSIWAIIGGALLIAGGVLFWFMRRAREDDDESWGTPMEAGDFEEEALAGTESMRAPARDDESFVVVEQEQAGLGGDDETMEVEAQREAEPVAAAPEPEPAPDPTGAFDSLEDTFSSDTAVNLDQSDPLAEADFHMAYGLYDQAADLVNGALEVEPERQDLLAKLCEIYFVWGNRDAFVDAAERLQKVTGGDSPDWDKTVIMGQQIAADNPLFAGAGVAGATKEVDLDFESGGDASGALDMDFGADDSEGGDDDEGLDFVFEGEGGDEETGGDALDFSIEDTAEQEQPAGEQTADLPAEEPTVETPTIEDQFAFDSGGDETKEVPSLDDAIEASGKASDETAEIDLDDLGLDMGDLEETEFASLDDDDATELASLDDLDSTASNKALEDTAETTGRNPSVDPDATGTHERPAADDVMGGLEIDDLDELTGSHKTSEMNLARDETGQHPMVDSFESTDTDLDDDLLEATGKTQVLSGDMAVDTGVRDDDEALGPDDETRLAPGLGDEEFDFAKTEALPKDAFSDESDATGEMPAVGSTDMDLDLDDLTAALEVSDFERGDTVEQPRDDATVEQPRPDISADDDTMETQQLSEGDMSDDLQDARTMTEVGTKLDLARAYVDMGDPAGARSILEEVLDEGDQSQRQQAQQLLDTLAS